MLLITLVIIKKNLKLNVGFFSNIHISYLLMCVWNHYMLMSTLGIQGQGKTQEKHKVAFVVSAPKGERP